MDNGEIELAIPPEATTMPQGEIAKGHSCPGKSSKPAKGDELGRTTRAGWRFAVAAVAITLFTVAAIAFARASFTRVPDALFVSDGFGYYLYLPSAWIDGDVDLANQLTRLPYEGEKAFYKVAQETGRHTNQFTIGCAVLWAPFFLFADGVVRGLMLLGFDCPRDGFGFAYELPVYLGSALYGLSGLALIRRTLRRWFDTEVADLSLFVTTFATPTIYYIVVEPNMSHAVSLFLVAAWVDALAGIDDGGGARLTPWLGLGLILGLVGLVRPYNAILGMSAIPIAIRGARPAGGSWPRAVVGSAIRLATIAAIAAIVMVPQSLVWKSLYGSWLVVPKGSGYEQIRWSWSSLASFIVSVFALWPAYLPAMLGLVLGSTAAVRSAFSGVRPPSVEVVAPCFVAVLAGITLLVANSRDWMLGTAFGQRRMVDWTVFFSIGLAITLSGWPRCGRALPRLLWGGAAGLATLNMLSIALYLIRRLPEYGRIF